MKKILITLSAFLLWTTPVFALPYYSQESTLIPEVNNARDLGTSTSVTGTARWWRNIFLRGNLTNDQMADGCAKWLSSVLTTTGTPCGAGVGGGGAGTFGTTTSNVLNELINYSLNNTDIVTIGGSATTSAKYWFDPNTSTSFLNGNVGIGSTSPSSVYSLGIRGDILGNLYVGSRFLATSSVASVFPYASTTAATIPTAYITKLGNLTTNGFVKTGSADGTLLVDTNTYLTGNQSITLSGDVSGSGATAITTTIGNGRVTNAMLANSTISGVALGGTLASHSHDSTLSGTSYTGSAAVSDWGINLGNANVWTASTTFQKQTNLAQASTSMLTVSGNTYLGSLNGILKGTNGLVGTASNGTDYSLISALTCGAGQHLNSTAANGTFTCSADTGSGGSGSGTFATTTSSVTGQLINYPLNNTDIVTVGGQSTSTAPFYVNPNTVEYQPTVGKVPILKMTTGSIVIGDAVPLQANGFGSGYVRLQISTSSNDIEQTQLINRSNGASSAGCMFLVNDKAALNTIGAASNYYGGTCLAGSNYNIPGFNGLKPNGIGLFATDGPVTIGSGSTNAASSSIYFQAGSGLDASYDMILSGGTGNLGIGIVSPTERLHVFGNGIVANLLTASNFTATSSVASIFPYASTTAITVSGITYTGSLQATASSTLQNFTGQNSTTTNATTTSLAITNSPSALLLTNANGSIGKYAGVTCTNQFLRALSALGASTCATVANTDLANSTISGVALGGTLNALTATNGTLTFSGSYDGTNARTVGLNLNSANVWTASTTFQLQTNMQQASTTLLTATNIYDSALTAGNCVQAGTNGLLTTTGSACGSGTGGGVGWASTTPIIGQTNGAIQATTQVVSHGTSTPWYNAMITSATSTGLGIQFDNLLSGSNLALWNIYQTGTSLMIGTSSPTTGATSTPAIQITSSGTHTLSIGTSTVTSVLNLDYNPASTASTTINMTGALQINSKEGGVNHCTFINSSGALTTAVGVCP